jgi:hypothetical protein
MYYGRNGKSMSQDTMDPAWVDALEAVLARLVDGARRAEPSRMAA